MLLTSPRVPVHLTWGREQCSCFGSGCKWLARPPNRQVVYSIWFRSTDHNISDTRRAVTLLTPQILKVWVVSCPEDFLSNLLFFFKKTHHLILGYHMSIEKVELDGWCSFSLCLECTKEIYLLMNMQIIDLKFNWLVRKFLNHLSVL